MINEYQFRATPEQAWNDDTIKQFIAREKGLDIRTIKAVRVLKKSIDARHRTIMVNLKVRAYVNEEPSDEPFVPVEYHSVEGRPRVIVVGAGPGGLFAALRLIEAGICPVVIERGKDIEGRRKDIALITKTQKIDPESNYSFGEGGAGTFSDGKLYTRSKKRGNVEKILNVFCQHGASLSILSDAHPHIGTDKLPKVIEHMRHTILECGGEVHFQTRMTGLVIESGKVTGILTEDGRHFNGPVILATGHSARDVYRWLFDNDVLLEEKGLACGVRLEHPSHLIDCLQYHTKYGKGKYLPTAEYSYVTQVDGRGVYSFCMCPGGCVVPAGSGPRQLVVNGMSPANRGTKWSNSGMVVEMHPEDLDEASLKETLETAFKDESLMVDYRLKGMDDPAMHSPLRMMYFQAALERQSWVNGNMKQTAPAQRMADFVRGKVSYDLPSTSYSPGVISSPLHFWMPSFISRRLQAGFTQFGQSSHGFLTNEAMLLAVETRTSSPVRVPRDKETLEHITTEGLFPCGEGAGYAGGIVSAAIDGERCAVAAAEYLKSKGTGITGKV